MENTFTNKFAKYINNESATILNEILNNKNFTIEEINIIFSLALWIINTRGVSDNTTIILQQFYELCKNEKVRKKKEFLKLLTDIIKECEEKDLAITVVYKNNPQNSLDANSIRDALQYKIDIMITIMSNSLNLEKNLEDKNFINILYQILNSNFDYAKHKFIIELYKNEIMKSNPRKRHMALEVALNREVDIMDTNSDLYPYVWSILTDKDILSLNDISYRKVVALSIVNIQSYPLYVALQQKNLTLKKKQAIIDYYYVVLEKYLTRYDFVDINTIKKASQAEIFSVVYCDRLISKDDEAYASTLKQIKQCINPLSYTIVLSSSAINEEQLKIALEIINKGRAIKPSKYTERYPKYDYKNYVAKVAISPVLTMLPLEQYKSYLLLIDSYCKQREELHLKDDIHLINQVANKENMLLGISSLFDNPTLFSNNIPRLLLAIEKISSSNSTTLTKEITKFCNNNTSAYYTDSEYIKIIEILKAEYSLWETNDNKHCLLVGLFTNKNVPFMEDKSPLFEIAKTCDAKEIKRKTQELNDQGQYNMNMYRIFYDVNQDIIRTISNNEIKYVRKLTQKH